MLPVAYRVIKGFATFFGIVGVISCIGGIIGGIIANDDLKKNKTQGSGQQQLTGSQDQGQRAQAQAAVPRPQALQGQIVS